MIIIIAFLIVGVVSPILSYLIDRDEIRTRGRTIRIISFCQIIVSCIAIGVSSYNDYQSGQQQDRIENYDSLNNKLSKEVKTLSELNNFVAQRIDTIVAQNKSLTEKNTILLNKSNDLIEATRRLAEVSQRLINKINTTTEIEFAENALAGEFSFDFGKPIYDSSVITVLFGGLEATNTLKPIKKYWFSGMHLIVFRDGFEPIKFDSKNDKLVISLKVYDLNGDLIVDIQNNRWIRYPNNTGKFNYDNRGFEIFDKKGNLVLNVDLLASNKIKLQGYLIDREHHDIMIGGREFGDWNWKDQPSDAEILKTITQSKITQLFEYSGKNWLGVRKPITEN